MNDSTKCCVAKILPGDNPNSPLPQPTRGTRVILSNGVELEGVTAVHVEAHPQGVWCAKVEVTVYLNEIGEMGGSTHE